VYMYKLSRHVKTFPLYSPLTFQRIRLCAGTHTKWNKQGWQKDVPYSVRWICPFDYSRMCRYLVVSIFRLQNCTSCATKSCVTS